MGIDHIDDCDCEECLRARVKELEVSERTHRNARIVLRKPSGCFERSGCLLHGDRPATQILGFSSVLTNMTTNTSIRMCDECCKALRGILASRLLAELRERVETMDLDLAWSADPETVAAFFSEGVLRIIDELGGEQ